MWKRLNTRDRQFDSNVGSPTLVQTMADQPIFRNSTALSPRPAFGRKGTHDVLKGLPALPLSNSLEISGVGETRPTSEVPTASSIYSQPSPEMNDITPTNSHPPRSSSLYPDDISPPGSIHTDNEDKGRNGTGSPDVSPISESPNPSIKESSISSLGRYNSNLPVPKKTRKFWNRPSSDSPRQGSSLTHWDVYSGEPTTSERGKPPSTTPSAVKLHADPSPGSLNGYGTSTHISAGNSSSGNGIGRKRVASRDLNNAPIIRPAWKGAGGRHKIVTPLLDKPLPLGQAPTFPIGSERYQQELREKERIAEEIARKQEEQPKKEQIVKERASLELKQKGQAHEAEENSKRQKPQNQNEPKAWERDEQEGKDRKEDRRDEEPMTVWPDTAQSPPSWKPDAPDQPPIPLNHGEFHQHTPPSERSNGLITPLSTKNLPLRNSSLTVEDDKRSPLARNPSNEKMIDRRSQALPPLPPALATEEKPLIVQSAQDKRPHPMPNGISEDKFDGYDASQIESRFRANLQHMHLHDEPPSRFSATTYATTTCDSPPDTPNLSSASPSVTTTPSSILNRKRPVPPAGIPSSKATNRKPTPSEMNVTTQTTPESRQKSLPKSPPEANAVSRVAGLQAKLENLRRRKGNLQTVVHELTHVVQPSSIAYDVASRQEIRRTVEGLNKELAEIIKDEHETGIKLHRAMKKDDEFAAYEPTSIWVRRVTS